MFRTTRTLVWEPGDLLPVLNKSLPIITLSKYRPSRGSNL